MFLPSFTIKPQIVVLLILQKNLQAIDLFGWLLEYFYEMQKNITPGIVEIPGVFMVAGGGLEPPTSGL